jgi:hypothetical protein
MSINRFSRGIGSNRPRLVAPEAGISSCQKGRLWSRTEEDDVITVQLNQHAGTEQTDSVVFPANSTEGASTRFMINTTESAIRGGAVTGTQWDEINRGTNSVAFGLNTIASGVSSTVPGGALNEASGIGSFAAGVSSSATQDGTFVWSDSIIGLASTQADEVTFGARGGFRVLNDGPGTPAYTPGDIYLDANSTVVTGKLTATVLQCTGVAANLAPITPLDGTFWVQNAVPSLPMFTDSAGTDFILSAGTPLAGNVWEIAVGGNVRADATAIGYSATNNILFGSQIMADSGPAGDIRMFLDKNTVGSEGSFRAGRASGTEWDTRGVESVAFGLNNSATGARSSALGGSENSASGAVSTIGGGNSNTAAGDFSVVPGGVGNIASGRSSFAGGETATATQNGTFVWSDQTGPLTSVRANEVTIGADGGFHVIGSTGTATPTYAATPVGSVYLDADAVITGGLDVTGLIGSVAGPTGFQGLQQTTGKFPALATTGTYWVENTAVTRPIFTDSAGVEHLLDPAEIGALENSGIAPNVLTRSDVAFNNYDLGASFVFGSQHMNDNGALSDRRFFYDKSTTGSEASFRAGSVSAGQWDAGNRGAGSVAFGVDNIASGINSVVTGGYSNSAIGLSASVGGGTQNVSTGQSSFIGAGEQNTITGIGGFIGAGGIVGGGATIKNDVTGIRGVVVGGTENLASAIDTFVGGGETNTASGARSVVCGGQGNTAGGIDSMAGGNESTVGFDHNNSFVWSGTGGASGTSTAANEVTFGADGGFRVFGNGAGVPAYEAKDIYLDAVNTVVTGKLTVTGLIDPTGLQCTEQANVPAVVPAGSGTYWVENTTPSRPVFTGDDNLPIILSGPGSSVFEINANVVRSDDQNPAYLITDDFVFGSQTLDGGDSRFFLDRTLGAFRAGQAATQWDNASLGAQSAAFGLNTTASGAQAAVGGGELNQATAAHSVVPGGQSNVASGAYSAVISGQNGAAVGIHSVVCGGDSNTTLVAAVGAFVGGGGSAGAGSLGINSAQAIRSAIVCGNNNIASGIDSIVGAGVGNVASGVASVVPGGRNNSANGDHSLAGGGGLAGAATATHQSTFVWSDSIAPIGSVRENEVAFGADGGFRVYGSTGTNTPAYATVAAGSVYLDASTLVTGDLAVTGLIGAPTTGSTGMRNAEQAAGTYAGVVNTGTYWVEDTGPTRAMFTDSAGTEFVLNTGGAFINLAAAGGAIQRTATDTTALLSSLTNDFVFGSQTTEDAGATQDARFLFDKSKGAFRAGSVDNTQWDDTNRGVGSIAFGTNTTALGANSTISGGIGHTTPSVAATISGGTNNTADGTNSAVGGGENNIATGTHSTVAGGHTNVITLDGGFIGGGGFIGAGAVAGNKVSGVRGGVVCGTDNTAGNLVNALVGGGLTNQATGANSGVLVGTANVASGAQSAVVAGSTNLPSAVNTAILGGKNNSATAADSVVGGGTSNATGGINAGILAGESNTISNTHAVICGGHSNINSALGGFVGAGGAIGPATSGPNTASGARAAVIAGTRNTASAVDSVVLGGNGSTASGIASIAGGIGSVSGPAADTLALGNGSTANAAGAMALGNACLASGITSFAAGKTSVASGANSVAMGTLGTSSGTESITLGASCTASAANSVAIGNTVIASGIGSLAFGKDATASNTGAVVFGDGAAGGNPRVSTVDGQITFGAIGGARFFTSLDETIGPFVAAGGADFAAVSDRNRKENIVPFTGVLERLESLPIYEYNYRGQSQEQIYRGPMAQDWHELFKSGKDKLSINTMDLDGVALGSIRELAGIVRSQNERINRLEAALSARDISVPNLEVSGYVTE